MKKEDLGFSVDERTEVPTYEEVASTFKKTKKTKKPYGQLFVILLLITAFSASGYFAYQYRDTLQTKAGGTGAKMTGQAIGSFKSIAGFVTNDIDYSDRNKFGIEIKEVKINLTNEEVTLKKSLTTSLNSACETEKSKSVKNAETQKDAECDKEVDKKEDIIDSLTSDLEDSAADLESCEDDLDDCESSGDDE
jgi:hypothetical protein